MNIFKSIMLFFTPTRLTGTEHYQKRFMRRRQQIMGAVLAKHYLDPYEIARRTGTTPSIVSKTLSTAYRDGEPLVRIKRRVAVAGKRSESVWCYRLRPDESKEIN